MCINLSLTFTSKLAYVLQQRDVVARLLDVITSMVVKNQLKLKQKRLEKKLGILFLGMGVIRNFQHKHSSASKIQALFRGHRARSCLQLGTLLSKLPYEVEDQVQSIVGLPPLFSKRGLVYTRIEAHSVLDSILLDARPVLAAATTLPCFSGVLTQADQHLPATEQLSKLVESTLTKLTPSQYHAIRGRYTEGNSENPNPVCIAFFEDLAEKIEKNREQTLLRLGEQFRVNLSLEGKQNDEVISLWKGLIDHLLLVDVDSELTADEIRAWFANPDHADTIRRVNIQNTRNWLNKPENQNTVRINISRLIKLNQWPNPEGLKEVLESCGIDLPQLVAPTGKAGLIDSIKREWASYEGLPVFSQVLTAEDQSLPPLKQLGKLVAYAKKQMSTQQYQVIKKKYPNPVCRAFFAEVAAQIQANKDHATLELAAELKQQDLPIPEGTVEVIRAWFNDPNNRTDIQGVTQLDLSYEGLNVLPDELSLFTGLQRLNLSYNRLTNVEGLSGLPQLQWLDLSA